MDPETYGVVFDDDSANLALAVRVLKRRYKVLGFASVEDGLPMLKDAAFVVTDYDMPGVGGAALVEMVRDGVLPVPVLILSGYDSLQPEAQDLKQLGIHFLNKPYAPDVLLKQVEAMLASHLQVR